MYIFISVHMYTKHKVSMSNLVPGGGVCTDDDDDATQPAWSQIHLFLPAQLGTPHMWFL